MSSKSTTTGIPNLTQSGLFEGAISGYIERKRFNVQRNYFHLVLSVAVVFCSGAGFITGQMTAPRNDRILIEHLLPPMNGAKLRATLVKVSYGPGASSRPHSHGCPVIGYVIRGAVRSQVNKQPEILLHAGNTFFEMPNSLHNISANASKTESAEFLAFMVCGGDQKLVLPLRKGEQGAQ